MLPRALALALCAHGAGATEGSAGSPWQDDSKDSLSDAGKKHRATRALHLHVGSNSLPRVKQAVEEGGDINAHTRDYSKGEQSPLMMASLLGRTEIAAYLLEQGADPTIGEKDGYTPLHGCAFQGKAKTCAMLLKHPNVPNVAHEDGNLPIHRACWRGDADGTATVAAFIDAGVDVSIPNSDGQTPLKLARRAGNAQSAALLEAALPGKRGYEEEEDIDL